MIFKNDGYPPFNAFRPCRNRIILQFFSRIASYFAGRRTDRKKPGAANDQNLWESKQNEDENGAVPINLMGC
jgi:hypothetical protein